MKALALVVVALALVSLVPAPVEAHPCTKPLSYARCPWPGGVGEFCVLYEDSHVCFGPI